MRDEPLPLDIILDARQETLHKQPPPTGRSVHTNNTKALYNALERIKELEKELALKSLEAVQRHEVFDRSNDDIATLKADIEKFKSSNRYQRGYHDGGLQAAARSQYWKDCNTAASATIAELERQNGIMREALQNAYRWITDDMIWHHDRINEAPTTKSRNLHTKMARKYEKQSRELRQALEQCPK